MLSSGEPVSPMLQTPTKSARLGDRSSFLTPTRGSGATPATSGAAIAAGGTTSSASFGTPERQVLSDRFIPDRGSLTDDARYHLPAKENSTPQSGLRGLRNAGESLAGAAGGRGGHAGVINLADTFASGSLAVSPSCSGGGGGVGDGGAALLGGGSCFADSPQVAALAEEPYVAALGRSLFRDGMQTSVLGMHDSSTANAIDESRRYERSLGVIYHENRQRHFKSCNFRVIPQTPERILDAPELVDDFYLNLLDWSSRNIMTVALSNTVYLWNADTGSITQLYSCDDSENITTSVSFHGDGRILAIGTNNAQVLLWDTETRKLLRTTRVHSSRVSSLHWNGDVLASGSRDTTIRLHDLRCPSTQHTFCSHTQEVCGLRWNPNGVQLASGGNDNLLNIWDARFEGAELRPLYGFRAHKAAIKALAWNPVRPNLLASGGGTADKTIKFWNTSNGTLLNSVDTKSQVCGLLWSKSGNEFVSSHGYVDNQLTLWKYPSLKRTTDLTGHNSRVLHLAMSPDGQMVVSAAGDETIRFWRCFAEQPRPQSPTHAVSPFRSSTKSLTPQRKLPLTVDDDSFDEQFR